MTDIEKLTNVFNELGIDYRVLTYANCKTVTLYENDAVRESETCFYFDLDSSYKSFEIYQDEV